MTETRPPTRHLDLGCGPRPRNPYGRDEVHAVDLIAPASLPADRFRCANLSIEPIPYPDNCFDSVSAYDFLEHVPRVLSTPDGRSTRFPFLDLMGEIHRVLKPGGRLYAVTPGFPRLESMVDPTHVNFITERTHRYFCEPDVSAQAYGYVGTFRALRVEWLRTKLAYEPTHPDLRHRLRRLGDRLMRRRAHLLWEFEALKAALQPVQP
jgi:SAM-dependent methyltransferase